MFWPSNSPIFGTRNRATVSLAPPAGYRTTRRTGRHGNCCACADFAANTPSTSSRAPPSPARVRASVRMIFPHAESIKEIIAELLFPFPLSPTRLCALPAWRGARTHELIAYAKNNPGKLTYGSAGQNSSGNLTGSVRFRQTRPAAVNPNRSQPIPDSGHPRTYSITLSARSRIDGGTASPSVFAAAILNVSPILRTCSIGRLLASAPLRILSTNIDSVLKFSVSAGP